MKTAPGRATSDWVRLPSLDGWRAVSILMVLGCHARRLAGFPGNLPSLSDWILDGDLGVRFFFIISGFLISWLMLTEQARTGAVSLRNFYIRRCFRILPVYLVFLGVLLAFQCFTAYSQSPRAWLANLTFTTNYASVPWPSQHLWSLSVEEQFYLLWPFIFVFLGIAGNWRTAVKVLLASLVIAPAYRFVAFIHFYPPSLGFFFTHLSFFRYFDSLAVGCGCAVLAARSPETVRTELDKLSKGIPFLAVGLILLPDLFNAIGMPGRIVAASGYSFQAFGFALLLLQSIFSPQLACYRWLNWAPVRHLGVLSYSIYIWQQIFFTHPADFGLKGAWWLAFPGAFVMIFIAAYISYYGLERPFLNIRARFRQKGSPIETPALPAATAQAKVSVSRAAGEICL